MPISIVPHKHQTTILRRATGGNHARTQSQRRLTSHVPDDRITYTDAAADDGCKDRMEIEKKQPETGAGTADSRLNARRTGEVMQTVGSERRTRKRQHGSFAPDERDGQRRRAPGH